MATGESTSTLDAMMSTWLSRKMIQNIEGTLIFGGTAFGIPFVDDLTETSREEPVAEILPKELLVHLEKGDRSDEFLEDRIPEGALTSQSFLQDAVSMMRNSDVDQMQRSMEQLQQGMGQMGGASAMFGNPFRGGFR